LLSVVFLEILASWFSFLGCSFSFYAPHPGRRRLQAAPRSGAARRQARSAGILVALAAGSGMLLRRAAAGAARRRARIRGRVRTRRCGLLAARILVALAAGSCVLFRGAALDAAGAARFRARARRRGLLAARILVALLAGLDVLLVGAALVTGTRILVRSHDHSFRCSWEVSCFAERCGLSLLTRQSHLSPGRRLHWWRCARVSSDEARRLHCGGLV